MNLNNIEAELERREVYRISDTFRILNSRYISVEAKFPSNINELFVMDDRGDNLAYNLNLHIVKNYLRRNWENIPTRIVDKRGVEKNFIDGMSRKIKYYYHSINQKPPKNLTHTSNPRDLLYVLNRIG